MGENEYGKSGHFSFFHLDFDSPNADLPTSGNQKLYSVIPKNVFSPKKLYFIIKTIFWGEKKYFACGARITSAKSFRPGSRDLRALEAHGF